MMNQRIIALAFAAVVAAIAAGTGRTAARAIADAPVVATSAPATTAPATAPADPAPRKNAAGEVVLTFADAPVGKAVPIWTEGLVTFALASPPQRSRAQSRVMVFPHLKTDHRGILNAMANE